MKKKLDKNLEKYFMPDLKKARKRIEKEIETVRYNLENKYENIGNGKTYSVLTYGCQGNEADSEIISGILESLGYEKGTTTDENDVVIINTCAVRENAENKIWGVLGRLKQAKRNNPDMIIGICGCMPQEENVVNTLLEKYHQIDIVFGTHNINNLPRIIYDTYMSKDKVIEVLSTEGKIVENMPKKRANKHRAWVNIMYGCDEFCTYCIVPYTRGKERSRDKDDVINEVKSLVSEGYVEVTLLGQNVNAYGKDLDNGYTFGDLLVDLDKTGIKRIRYTTSHPRDLDDKTIQAMATCKSVMPHIHLPVQSGNDEVLKRMNRKYTKDEYLVLIEKLKKAIPGIAITTDIIVAFPGETQEQFQDTLELVDEVKFDGAFTFIYSPREGTPASKYENLLTEEEKHARLNELVEHTNRFYKEGNERFVGKVVEVLVDEEAKEPGMVCGYSEHFKLVNFVGDKSLIGSLVKVRITEAKTWFVKGELVE